MTENLDSGPTGNEAPSKKASTESGETRKSTSDDNLFNTGYGKGLSKGKTQLLEELGAENIDQVRSALQFASERREEEKSVADKLAEMTSKFDNIESEVKTYREVAKAEATVLFESLSDDNKAAIEASAIPVEKMIPVMRQMTAAPPATKKVGASVNPPSDSVESQINEFKTRSGLDPDYRKDPRAYAESKMAAYKKKELGEDAD